MLKAIQQAGEKRLVLLGMFLVVFLGASSMHAFLRPLPAYAHTSRPAYECGNNTSGHCYGVVNWYGGTRGAESRIVVEPIDCSNINPADGSCGALFLTNEIWMVDSTSSQAQYCRDFGTAACWVEAGYMRGGTYVSACNWGFAGTECYYWADERPNGGFHVHYNILPSDNYGHHTRFKIKWLGNGSWDVLIQPLINTDGYWDSTSTSNTIYPQDIQIGEELAGAASSATDGLYTPTTADWDHNEWADGNVVFYYQTDCGTNCTAGSGGGAPPPDSQWAAVPNCCNYGGDWQAWTPYGS